MKVVEAIAKVLKAEGVEVLFAYPVNPIIEAAAAENIRTVIVRMFSFATGFDRRNVDDLRSGSEETRTVR